MFRRLFDTITAKEKQTAIEDLIHASTPRADFFLMIILSIMVATFGLFLNSSAIIIGSMLIAPILYPVLGISLGVVMSNYELIGRSVATVLKSFLAGVMAAIVITFLFYGTNTDLTPELLARAQASIPYFLVAVTAGFAVAFALVKPELSSLLPGVAVTVALVPPLAAVGAGVALAEWQIAAGAFVLFWINVFGIVVASLVVFSMMNLYVKHRVAERAIKHEEKELNG